MSASYQPPFTLSGELVTAVANIAEHVGRLSATPGFERDLRLRRINRIRSITGSLAIEGNTLTEAQITDLLDGKLVMAPPRELQEARNALAAYDELPKWDGLNEEHLLTAHRALMRGLLDHPGVYRSVGVGVFAGSQPIHMAPPADQVPRLMGDLFGWLRATDLHPLIGSSVFHYEFEFIHPFRDGNGRMGRLWQTLLLSRWNPAFAWLPVESLVHQQQDAYYAAIRASTKATDCAPFIRFMLGCVQDAVTKALAASAKVSEKTPQKTRRKTPQKTPDMILALLRAHPELSFADLATELSKSESAIKRAVRKLREQGRLTRIGPDKGGHWKVITKPRGKTT